MLMKIFSNLKKNFFLIFKYIFFIYFKILIRNVWLKFTLKIMLNLLGKSKIIRMNEDRFSKVC